MEFVELFRIWSHPASRTLYWFYYLLYWFYYLLRPDAGGTLVS